MQFFPAGRSTAAQVKTFVKEGHGLALGAFVGFFLAHEDFNLLSQQSANGGVAPGGDDLGFTNGLAVQADGKILLHSILPVLDNTCLTCSTYRMYTTYDTCAQEGPRFVCPWSERVCICVRLDT